MFLGAKVQGSSYALDIFDNFNGKIISKLVQGKITKIPLNENTAHFVKNCSIALYNPDVLNRDVTRLFQNQKFLPIPISSGNLEFVTARSERKISSGGGWSNDRKLKKDNALPFVDANYSKEFNRPVIQLILSEIDNEHSMKCRACLAGFGLKEEEAISTRQFFFKAA